MEHDTENMTKESQMKLSQHLRAVEMAGPDGPCVVLQSRPHPEEEWMDDVTLYTEELRRLGWFTNHIDGLGDLTGDEL